ncbi:MAG: radical SAM protein [Candidatus Omnitrophica bacterium]|nr:radical SAM protein [Candidatus Omnitrophota bacterium]MDD5552699.1 radical SAM protein [Candidatus Omnitrophota bacterium]
MPSEQNQNCLGKIKPKGCILILTLECIFKCRMCHLWRVAKDDSNAPSIAQWKDFISSFDDFVEKGDCENKFTITFGGGEPLLREAELLELVGFSSKRGYWASIASNGYLFNPELTRKLIDSGLHYLGLSLDSLHEKTHDSMRGVEGSHKKVLEIIEFLPGFKERPVLAVNAIIMKPNLDGILELARWVDGKERISSLLLQALMQPFHDPTAEDWQKQGVYSGLWPDDAQKVKSVIDGLIEMKLSGDDNKPSKISNPVSQLETFREYFTQQKSFLEKIKCRVLESGFFSISPNGDVNLCPFMDPIGNIKEAGIKQLWESGRAEEIRGRMLSCRNACHHLVNCWYEE